MPAYLSAARLTNPNVRFVGISLNTSGMTEPQARDTLSGTSRSLRLPCVDPLRTGVDVIVDALETAHAG